MNLNYSTCIDIDNNSGYIVNNNTIVYYEFEPVFKRVEIMEIMYGTEQDSL